MKIGGRVDPYLLHAVNLSRFKPWCKGTCQEHGGFGEVWWSKKCAQAIDFEPVSVAKAFPLRCQNRGG